MGTTKGTKRPTYDRPDMQLRVIEALRAGRSLSEACTENGLRRVTVWRWSKDDPAFERQLSEASESGRITASSPVGSVPPLELAYAAGLFDGEGSIRIARGTKRKTGRVGLLVMVQMTNTNVDAVQYFHDRWPGYWERDKVNGKNPNAKRYHAWKLAGVLAEKFLRDIYPFLRIKRPQAELVFEFRAFQGDGRRNRDRTDEEYERLYDYHVRMRTLNARGVAPPTIKPSHRDD